ncbi:lactate utilization protein [Marinilabiliaceae bacterium JC040]|nr:lactate utilization protein [Marinilabiliaceae bacterium JC040]
MKTSVERTIKNLETNNFEVFYVENTIEAYELFTEEIFKVLSPRTVSYGDSLTMHECRIIDFLKEEKDIDFIDTFSEDDSWREQIMKRKEALSADLFVTGTNAITESGQLVNLDMIGNRVGGICFGPRYVVLFVGVNKIVKNLEEAFNRVRNLAAPANSRVHENLKTPCKVTGVCHDCKSPQRLCNTWTINEKSYPQKRIKIILINEELGF